MERTLQRFHTDHVDLYQSHAVTSMEDVDKILGPNGAAEIFLPPGRRAKSGMSVFPPTMHRSLSCLTDALELDSVMFPVNVNAWENGGFGPQILGKANSKGMARMALKARFCQPIADKLTDPKVPSMAKLEPREREVLRDAIFQSLDFAYSEGYSDCEMATNPKNSPKPIQ